MKGRAAATKNVIGGMKICAWCLGRQYASSQSEIEKAGLRAASELGIRLSKDCELCGDVYGRRRKLERRIADELRGVEFSTFQVGVTLSNDSVEREDEMRSKLRLSSGISLKKGLTTLFRKELASSLHKKPSLRSPEVTIRIGLPEESVTVERKPVTVYIEYLKLKRDIPIRAVPCRNCRGEGCAECDGTGIEKGDVSLEAELTKSFLSAFAGRKVRVSWSGIEDESSLLVGNGRPAYIEVVSPARRATGLNWLNMTPSHGVQLTRAELEPLDRNRIEDLVKEVFIEAEFESELGVADVILLEQAYKERDLREAGNRKGRPKKVYAMKVVPRGTKARMHLFLDNGISLRQLLAPKADAGKGQEGPYPSLADLLPANRIITAESDIVGFRKTGY